MAHCAVVSSLKTRTSIMRNRLSLSQGRLLILDVVLVLLDNLISHQLQAVTDSAVEASCSRTRNRRVKHKVKEVRGTTAQ